MGTLTIMEKNAPCADDIDWPLFYMNDFSVCGLLVEGLARCVNVLAASGYQLIRARCSAKVIFENPRRLRNIYDTLASNGIAYESADLVSGVYQG